MSRLPTPHATEEGKQVIFACGVITVLVFLICPGLGCVSGAISTIMILADRSVLTWSS